LTHSNENEILGFKTARTLTRLRKGTDMQRFKLQLIKYTLVFVVVALSSVIGLQVVDAKVRVVNRVPSSDVETVEVKENGISRERDRSRPVGAKAATKFFKKDQETSRSPSEISSEDHFLAIHLGTFVDSDAYVWGDSEHADDPGKLNLGVTYRIGEWTNTMDLLFRVDFINYELLDGKPMKMSLLPMILFPDATSKFPLYFGAGIGPGVFFKQLPRESSVSLDYQLIAGARAFDLIENTGFFIETGLKNHLHLLSDGQFNGVFVSAGAIFTF